MCFNIVELLDPQHSFARHRQLGALIKVIELTPHVRHAGHLFDASRSVRVIVARIGVRMGKALVGRQMLTGMSAPRLVENWYHTAGGTPLAQVPSFLA